MKRSLLIQVEPGDFTTDRLSLPDGCDYGHGPICSKLQDAMADIDLVPRSQVEFLFYVGDLTTA